MFVRKILSLFDVWTRNTLDPEPLGSEPPRDAINAGLELVSKLMEPDNYVLRRRQMDMRRVDDDLTFIIRFKADRHNREGVQASVWMYLRVESKGLTAWRRAHPSDWIRSRDIKEPGLVLDVQVGNLCMNGRWPRWDFARPAARPRVSLDAATTIRNCALPLFESFGDLERCVPSLMKIPAVARTPLLEYALSRDRGDLAEREIAALLKARRPFNRRFRAKLSEYAKEGPPLLQEGELRDQAVDLATLTLLAPIHVARPS